MIFQDFIDYLVEIKKFDVEVREFPKGNYLVIKDYNVISGEFKGSVIDIGIKVVNRDPFLPVKNIQIKPRIDSKGQKRSKNGKYVIRNVVEDNRIIGPEWQYWSISFPTPIINPEQYWNMIFNMLLGDVYDNL